MVAVKWGLTNPDYQYTDECLSEVTLLRPFTGSKSLIKV